MALIYMDVGEVETPHIYPRATEISYVLEGEISTSFRMNIFNRFYKILGTFSSRITNTCSNLGYHVFNILIGLEGAAEHELRVVAISLH
jgi:hypothetical protein